LFFSQRIAFSDWLTPSNIRFVQAKDKPFGAQMLKQAMLLGVFKTIWMEDNEGKQQDHWSPFLRAALSMAGKERDIESNSLRDILEFAFCFFFFFVFYDSFISKAWKIDFYSKNV
jgi:hypothetical protein